MPLSGAHMGWSKNCSYETPYIVTGDIKCAGPLLAPKDIYVQIKLSERGKLGAGRLL